MVVVDGGGWWWGGGGSGLWAGVALIAGGLLGCVVRNAKLRGPNRLTCTPDHAAEGSSITSV